MGGIIRRIKAVAIWVDSEDKDRFERILIDRTGEMKQKQTQMSTFKFILDEFFKLQGGKR